MACVTNYTIQCRDVTSGEVGCFLFETEHWQRTGEFKATSPVFSSLAEFFTWDNQHSPWLRGPCHLERTQ